MAEPGVLTVYRHILKAAARYPSKNRSKIVAEIKAEYRVNAKTTDAAKVAKQRELALQSLVQLQSYTRLDSNSSQWEVQLQGMPKPEEMAAGKDDGGSSSSRPAWRQGNMERRVSCTVAARDTSSSRRLRGLLVPAMTGDAEGAEAAGG
eukprot:CAMPEP_0183789204 /NCGR_PEP_ID=MMETSP0803_2-20130417/278_1 /TAXON_ID=195967 /ORGANISM="Crustomastix stigmata, Strain CCMP3273" /LENGTH=148 /DNA_ID=CAMNT_0026033365 /DNA_START=12 /DNA_END=456 /DNA_ORIENTATION=+